jgi:hypothetical protein
MSVFENLGGSEYQPNSMSYRPPTKETFVIGRTTQRWTPTSGSSYSALNARTITFRLSSESMLDPATAYLNLTLKTPRGYVVPEDLAPLSLISAVRLTVAGSQTEQYTSVGDAVKPLMYVSSAADYLSGNASASMGSWLYRPNVGVGLATTGPNTIGTVSSSIVGPFIGGSAFSGNENSLGVDATDSFKFVGSTYRSNSFPAGFEATTLSTTTKFTGRTVNGIDYQGQSYSIPLALIFGLFRVDQYLPLRVMGAIELTIELNQPSRTLIVCKPLVYAASNEITEGSADAYTLDYQVTNLSIAADLVSVNPSAAADIDALAAGSTGLSLVIPTLVTTLFPSQQGGTSQQSLVCTRPYSNLTAQFVTMRPSAGANSAYWPKSMYFGGSRFLGCQSQIGGLSWPAQAIQSLSQAWVELRKALAGTRGTSIDKGSAVGFSEYACQYPSPYGAWSAASRGAAPDITEITNASATDVTRSAFANSIASMPKACFVIGQNFSRVIGSDMETSLSGQNSRLSGYSVQTNLTMRPYVASPNNTNPDANPACSLDSALFDTPIDYLVTQSVSVLMMIRDSSVMVSD